VATVLELGERSASQPTSTDKRPRGTAGVVGVDEHQIEAVTQWHDHRGCSTGQLAIASGHTNVAVAAIQSKAAWLTGSS